ncbi:hypothetical protein GIB67_029695 [Kingdonia uniflora]|uniref:Gamma-tubulin complex component n=1 Tax=Kingdonia uniflora TaxID=39325 RepID=A0A7J7LLK2_9MAGN|nr:hypothetical protein GIB67_029695 [Kingdonia uniflora]
MEFFEIGHEYRETNRLADGLADLHPDTTYMELHPNDLPEGLKRITQEDIIGVYFRVILLSLYTGEAKAVVRKSLVNKIQSVFFEGVPFAASISTLTDEFHLVRVVLQMLQGYSTSLFHWDENGQKFRPQSGIYLTHLSQTSLDDILGQFVHGATCFQLVEIFIKKVDLMSLRSPPTLKAFANSVSSWLKRLRSLALKEERNMLGSSTAVTPTLLGLANALSSTSSFKQGLHFSNRILSHFCFSLCSGAEDLLDLVRRAIPCGYFDNEPLFPACGIAVHILNILYKKLNEDCLVQGGEEQAYQMLLYIFIGSLLPYIEDLDSWLYDGTLDDPFQEVCYRVSALVESILDVLQDGHGSFQAHRLVKTHVSESQVRIPAPFCIDGVSQEDHIRMTDEELTAFVEGSSETENGYASGLR